MNLRLLSLVFFVAGCVAVPAGAVTPPMPMMTNGDGNMAHNGMKHANISLTDMTLAARIADPPPTPVTMMSGFGVDYTPAKFDVLENVYFNAQHGWLPEGIFSPPAGGSIWIKRTAATQPAGSAFHVYEGGNGMEGMAAWTMNRIYDHDGYIWQWDGAMQHDYFTADRTGNYSMSFEVFVGDSTGTPLDGYTPATATFQFRAVPEPSSALLLLCGLVGFVRLRH
jgi:hypothetical protein